MTRTRLLGFLRLFRFELPFAAGGCVVLGQFLALDSIPPLHEIVLGFVSVFFISATALILNDYFDIEIDRINAPHRPPPSGMVSKRDVLVLSFVVAFLGLLASALIRPAASITIFVVWIVGVLYNWRFKRSGLIGNLMVSFSVGMTFVFGGISVGQPGSINVWWFGAVSFLMDLGEEIAADATDIVILHSTVRLLNPATRNPRAQIRAIYLGGFVAVLLFIGLRVIGGWAVAT